MKENERFFIFFFINKTIFSCLWTWVFAFFVHSCVAADDDRRSNDYFCPKTCQVMDSSAPFNLEEIYHHEQGAPQSDKELAKAAEQGNADTTAAGMLSLVMCQAIRNEELKKRQAAEHEEFKKRQAIRNEEFKKQLAAEHEGFKKRRAIQNEELAKPWALGQEALNKIQAEESKKHWAIEDEKHIALAIPLVAQGHDAVYERFVKGGLIFQSTRKDEGGIVVKLPIRELVNPLAGTFCLARCGTREKYLKISTGYRKERNPKEHEKVEIWIALRFLIENELNTTAAYLQPIMANWKEENPVGIFWNWSEEDIERYEYVTTSMECLSNSNLRKNYERRKRAPGLNGSPFVPHRGTGNYLGLGRLYGSEFIYKDEVK